MSTLLAALVALLLSRQVWDDELGFLLGPAVFAYEQERVSGASFGGGDFQDAIQGAVPDRCPAFSDAVACDHGRALIGWSIDVTVQYLVVEPCWW